MKELIGIFLVGLFGFAIWKTRQVATTAPRCPTVDELEAINRDIFEGKTDLVDAENLAKSYDAIAGCDAASASIRATILAKKSTGTSTSTPPILMVDTSLLPSDGKKAPIDVDLLVPPAKYSKELGAHLLEKTIDPLSVAALSSPVREDVQRILSKPASEWTGADKAIYGALMGVGAPPSPGCEGLQHGEILADWFARKVFVCNPSLDEWKAGVRKTVLAEHPDNAVGVIYAHVAETK
jgi:hypothetical protein